MALKKLIPAVFLAIASLAYANLGDLVIFDRVTEVFNNTNCFTTATCDLEKIEYLVEDYSVELLEGSNYGTRFAAKYTTSSVENLENYVFVQAIKGCVFNSQIV